MLELFMEKKLETATFAAGCFWCVEAVFKELRGVDSLLPGYSGGNVESATYEEVSEGTTGHAEAVQIKFDPSEITYKDLVKIFFTTHDPTTLNKQGNDQGTQYRSAIFYHDEEQKRIAEEAKKEISEMKIYDDEIVTEIVPFKEFYEAEDYHKDYYAKNMNQPYCQVVIAPKVAKLRKQYAEFLKKN